MPPRQMRTLLIAALFHDFDHTGRPHRGEEDPDGINIAIAISGFRRYLASDDHARMPEIEALIEATHFPYKVDSDKLDLLGKIIRDADLAQALNSGLDSTGGYRFGTGIGSEPAHDAQSAELVPDESSVQHTMGPAAVSSGTHRCKNRGGREAAATSGVAD